MCDVDRDGRVELVVALTDRVVRVYRWQDDALRAISKCELMQQVSGNPWPRSDGSNLGPHIGLCCLSLDALRCPRGVVDGHL